MSRSLNSGTKVARGGLRCSASALLFWGSEARISCVAPRDGASEPGGAACTRQRNAQICYIHAHCSDEALEAARARTRGPRLDATRVRRALRSHKVTCVGSMTTWHTRMNESPHSTRPVPTAALSPTQRGPVLTGSAARCVPATDQWALC